MMGHGNWLKMKQISRSMPYVLKIRFEFAFPCILVIMYLQYYLLEKPAWSDMKN